MQLLLLKTILVATDLDDTSTAAIAAASELANAAGAALHAVFVATENGSGGGVLAVEQTTATLLDVFARAGLRLNDSNAHVLSGDPAYAIGALADRVHADVIVLGPHRARKGGVSARTLGSTALAIVTSASAPCLIVSESLVLPLERVLVPIDLSDTSRGALLVGLSWASALRGGTRRDATLTALHVHRSSGDPKHVPRIEPFENQLALLRADAGSWAGVSIQGATAVNTDVTEGITAFAGSYRPQLVVMGTRGLGLDTVGRLGSVAGAVSQRLSVPTLLVPPAIWIAHAAGAQ